MDEIGVTPLAPSTATLTFHIAGRPAPVTISCGVNIDADGAPGSFDGYYGEEIDARKERDYFSGGGGWLRYRQIAEFWTDVVVLAPDGTLTDSLTVGGSTSRITPSVRVGDMKDTLAAIAKHCRKLTVLHEPSMDADGLPAFVLPPSGF